MFEVKNRDAADPVRVAAAAKEMGEEIASYAGRIYEQNALARDLYETKESYIVACNCAGSNRNYNEVIEDDKILKDFDTTPSMI